MNPRNKTKPTMTQHAPAIARAKKIAPASPLVKLIGLEIEELRAGYCRSRLPARAELMNQGGRIHGGIYAVVADHTAGTAASTMTADDQRVVTAEYKLNILAPGECEALVTEAKVIKSGRRLVVGEADIYGETGGERKLLAKALLTFAVIPRNPRA